MAVSKNNPNARDNMRLVVSCPTCEEAMTIVKRVPGGMFYVCSKGGHEYPITKGCYKELPFEWKRK